MLPPPPPAAAAELQAVIPRRSSLSGERGVLLTCATTHKQKNLFFMLLQVG